MPDAKNAFRALRRKLVRAGFDPINEANVIFETATGLRPYAVMPGDHLTVRQLREIVCLFRLRASGEPLQYIAGRWPFLDFVLTVGHGVLVPRDETEELAQLAIEYVREKNAPRVLDLCSGSGCVAIAVKRAAPQAEVTAVELSEEALVYLRKNAAALCGPIAIECGDVFAYQDALPDAAFDLITANPPYVTPRDYESNLDELKNEPRMAFLGGADGLDFYRHIVPAYFPKLKPGGKLVFETGFDQTEAVAALMREAGYRDVRVHIDLFGAPRNVEGTRP